MDRFAFLCYCAANAAVYVLAKYYHIVFTPYSTVEIMAYMNLNSFLLCTPYLCSRFRSLVSGFRANAKLSITAPSSLLKIFTIQYIQPTNAMVIGFLTPIAVALLSFLLLGEYDEKYWKKYPWLLVSFLGVIVYLGLEDLGSHAFVYSLLLIHVLLRAVTNIFLKQLSRDRYITLFYSIFYYCILSILVFSWYRRFDWHMVIKKEIFLFSAISISSQFALIKSYEIAKKVSLLQNLDYSRILFGCVLSYFILGYGVRFNQLLGMGIITLSMLLSNIDHSHRSKFIKLFTNRKKNKP
jgi:drug/metabolite transporter (DMT)-like permease